MSGVSKSQVSRLCEEIDERVQAFLQRPIEGDWPYLFLMTCRLTDLWFKKGPIFRGSDKECNSRSEPDQRRDNIECTQQIGNSEQKRYQ